MVKRSCQAAYFKTCSWLTNDEQINVVLFHSAQTLYGRKTPTEAWETLVDFSTGNTPLWASRLYLLPSECNVNRSFTWKDRKTKEH